uniref:Uncharacterized protein n=1 Tax=Magnetospirillum gryphiswaldense TaxID=55518 RepID=Q3BKE7_9PROT|nr:hypothetical protein mgI437 [Magnetospirillum gryphiswaldense MSR-1]CAM77988.1 hypothetical protein MGR_4056 [Magnetospirillum gryphiswaldense MSR-1]
MVRTIMERLQNFTPYGCKPRGSRKIRSSSIRRSASSIWRATSPREASCRIDLPRKCGGGSVSQTWALASSPNTCWAKTVNRRIRADKWSPTTDVGSLAEELSPVSKMRILSMISARFASCSRAIS